MKTNLQLRAIISFHFLVEAHFKSFFNQLKIFARSIKLELKKKELKKKYHSVFKQSTT